MGQTFAAVFDVVSWSDYSLPDCGSDRQTESEERLERENLKKNK